MTPTEILTSILLITLNIIAGQILANIKYIKDFSQETREKLDKHVEDYKIHGFRRQGDKV